MADRLAFPTSGAARRVSGGRPCPACGQPLYGWAVVESRDPARPGEHVLKRCEACGLGLRDADPRLEPGPDGRIRVANRRSWQAGIGGSHWAAIEPPDRSLYPTPEALVSLLEKEGLEPLWLRQPPLGRNQLWMWQTLLNGLTFHDNFATRVARGRLRPRGALRLLMAAVDSLVTVLAALPVAIVALPLELLAVVFRRGGEIEAEVARLRD